MKIRENRFHYSNFRIWIIQNTKRRDWKHENDGAAAVVVTADSVRFRQHGEQELIRNWRSRVGEILRPYSFIYTADIGRWANEQIVSIRGSWSGAREDKKEVNKWKGRSSCRIRARTSFRFYVTSKRNSCRSMRDIGKTTGKERNGINR